MIKVYFITDEYGTTYWYKEGTYILHKDDGPAVEYIDGSKFWFQNGRRHRIDGPAVEYMRGKEYWLNDKSYPDIKTDKEWLIFQIIN